MLAQKAAAAPRSAAKSPGTFAVEWRPRPSGRRHSGVADDLRADLDQLLFRLDHSLIGSGVASVLYFLLMPAFVRVAAGVAVNRPRHPTLFVLNSYIAIAARSPWCCAASKSRSKVTSRVMRVGLSMRQERPLFLQSLPKWYAAETDEKGPIGHLQLGAIFG
jgi:hypothetical protein